MDLTIYGDFNCPYSALASYRLSWIEAARAARVTWCAVEHDPGIPLPSRPLEGRLASDLDRELEDVLGLLSPGEVFPLRRPPVQPNTHAVNQRFAGSVGRPLAHPGPVRRRVFRALWVKGDDLGDGTVLDRLALPAIDRQHTADRWQAAYHSLPSQTVPSIVTKDGTFLAGTEALSMLAELGRSVTKTSLTHPLER